MLRLKASKKNKEWFKDIADYYLPGHNNLYLEGYEEKKALYEFFNNDISAFEEDINRLCSNVIDLGSSPDLLLPYNKIASKYGILEGDLIKRANNHKLILLSAKAVRNKNSKLLESINSSVERDLGFELEKFQMQLSGKSKSEIDQFIQEFRQSLQPEDLNYKNFQTDVEIYKSKMLDYTMNSQDIMHKKLNSFKHEFITDEMYLYNGWKNGRPYIQVLNPLYFGFHKGPNVPFVQKGDYAFYQDELSITDALDEYINKLDDEDIKLFVDQASKYNGINKDHLSKYIYNNTKFYATMELQGNRWFNERGVGQYQGDNTLHPARNHTIYRTHLEFKAYKPVMFVSYLDDYRDRITVQLDKDTSVIPNSAQRVEYLDEFHEKNYKYIWKDNGIQLEAVIRHIPRRYEVTRLGYNIDIDGREVPLQPNYTSNPYTNFELSYKGGIVNSMNSKSLSLMQEALPYQMQIFAVKALQNRELAKYEGYTLAQDVDQIPDELAQDAEGLPIEGTDKITQANIIRKKTNQALYSSSQSSNGLPPPPTRPAGISVMQLGFSQEFLNLQNLIQLIDLELGTVLGVPPQREGQTVPGTNVTDNQQSLIQSSLRTEYKYWWHQKVWSHALNEHLMNLDEYFRMWFRRNPDAKEHLLEYVTPDGTKELIKILPEYLDHSDIGLFLHDSSDDNMYIKLMTEKVLQNTLVDPQLTKITSDVIKHITSGASAEEIHRKIEMASDKLIEVQQQNAERQEQAHNQALEAQAKLQQDNNAMQISLVKIKEQESRLTEVQKALIEAESRIAEFKELELQQMKNTQESKEKEKDRKHESEENAKDRENEMKISKQKATSNSGS